MGKLNFTENTFSSTYIFNIVDDTALFIKKFSRLKPGWDFGSGEPISEYVIKRALKVFAILNSPLLDHEVTPYSDDTILISFSNNENFIDVLISKSKLSFKHEKGLGNNFDVIEEHDNLSLEKIKVKVEQILTKCISFGPFILTSIVEENKGLKTVSPIFTGEFQSLKNNAQSQNLEMFAITSGTFTPAQYSYQ